jgi:hypothetical protein
MTSAKTSALVFSSLFGGALLGEFSGPFLTAEQLRGVQIGVGLLTTMFGLLLSLQLAAGKTYFDNQEQDVTLVASRTVLLDKVLARYGPDAREARELLRDKVAGLVTQVWPEEGSADSPWTPKDGIGVYDKIQELVPKDDDQRSVRTLALGMTVDLEQTRWISASRIRSSTAVPLMVVETVWATIIFICFGLLAPHGVTGTVSLALFASAVSSGFFLIEEMNRPFSGLLKVSSAPIREVLKHLGTSPHSNGTGSLTS